MKPMPEFVSTDPNMGELRTPLYERIVSGGDLVISAPPGHQFAIKIKLVEAALAQSCDISYRRSPNDVYIGFGILGGDGMVGKTPTDWLTGKEFGERGMYQLVNRSWYFGKSKHSNGTRIVATEYSNGVLLELGVDDAGMWQNSGSPDGDYNDLLLQIWLRKTIPSSGWAGQVEVNSMSGSTREVHHS